MKYWNQTGFVVHMNETNWLWTVKVNSISKTLSKGGKLKHAVHIFYSPLISLMLFLYSSISYRLIVKEILFIYVQLKCGRHVLCQRCCVATQFVTGIKQTLIHYSSCWFLLDALICVRNLKKKLFQLHCDSVSSPFIELRKYIFVYVPRFCNPRGTYVPFELRFLKSFRT